MRPVGGDEEMPFDVRVIAATNRDLRALVDEGRFREDLYFRINVIHVALPPLRARGGDVLLLAQHFLDVHAARAGKRVDGARRRPRPRSCSPTAGRATCASCRTASSARSRSRSTSRSRVEDLPETVRAYKRSHVLVASGRSRPSWCRSRRSSAATSCASWRPSAATRRSAAQILGVDRKTLYRKLEEYGGGEAQKDA